VARYDGSTRAQCARSKDSRARTICDGTVCTLGQVRRCKSTALNGVCLQGDERGSPIVESLRVRDAAHANVTGTLYLSEADGPGGSFRPRSGAAPLACEHLTVLRVPEVECVVLCWCCS